MCRLTVLGALAVVCTAYCTLWIVKFTLHYITTAASCCSTQNIKRSAQHQSTRSYFSRCL